MTHRFENHDLVTDHAAQMIDVTDGVRGAVERAEIENGMALVYSPHTTCAVIINEREAGFADDFAELLAALAPAAANRGGGGWRVHLDRALGSARRCRHAAAADPVR